MAGYPFTERKRPVGYSVVIMAFKDKEKRREYQRQWQRAKRQAGRCVHHWLLDTLAAEKLGMTEVPHDYGVCQKCGKEKQFVPELKVTIQQAANQERETKKRGRPEKVPLDA